MIVLKNNWLFEDVSPTGFCYLKRKLTSSEPEGCTIGTVPFRKIRDTTTKLWTVSNVT
jgi:hypothetical protein